MWNKFVSFVLLLNLAACSVVPQMQDSRTQAEPIPEVVAQAYQQGLTLLQQQQYAQALEHWQHMAQNWPDYPGVWSNLALAQWHLAAYEQALTSTQQALALDAQFCPALSLQGLLLRQQGQFQQALDSYQQALSCDPDNADIAFNLGVLYDLYLQDITQALVYYQQAQQHLEEHEALAMWIEDLRNRQPQRLAGEAE